MNFTDNPQTLSKLLANSFLFCFLPEVLTGSKWTVSIWVFICFYFPHTPPVEMLMNNDRGKKHRWQEDKEKKQKPGWLEHQPASSQECLNIGGLQEHLLLTMRKGKGGGGGAWSLIMPGHLAPCFTKHFPNFGSLYLQDNTVPGIWDPEDMALTKWKWNRLSS